jgi:hypothetical protein
MSPRPVGRARPALTVARVDWLAGMLLLVLAVDLSRQDAVRIVQRRAAATTR